jgi:ubiquinone/menaquinone biosynthesis C-methylase UbiE
MENPSPRSTSIEELIRIQAEKHPLVQRRGFKTVADYCNHLMYQKAYEDVAQITRGKRVLDLGCNDGFGSALLAGSGGDVVGVDVSTKSLREAAERYRTSSVRFVPVDGIHLPFQDHSFDVVTSFQVIEHVADYDAYLSEIRRVLRPQGAALFTTPNAKIRLDPGMPPWNALHVREFSALELEALLKKWFPSVTISGLFGTPEIYAIEFNRVQEHLAKARRSHNRLIPEWWVIRAKILDAVKSVVPARLIGVLRTMLLRTSPPAQPKIDDAPSHDHSARFSTRDLFYDTNDLDRSLGLMASCKLD